MHTQLSGKPASAASASTQPPQQQLALGGALTCGSSRWKGSLRVVVFGGVVVGYARILVAEGVPSWSPAWRQTTSTHARKHAHAHSVFALQKLHSWFRPRRVDVFSLSLYCLLLATKYRAICAQVVKVEEEEVEEASNQRRTTVSDSQTLRLSQMPHSTLSSPGRTACGGNCGFWRRWGVVAT